MLSNFVEWDVFGVVLVLFMEEFCDTVKNIVGSGGTALSIAMNSIEIRACSLVTSILFDMIEMSI